MWRGEGNISVVQDILEKPSDSDEEPNGETKAHGACVAGQVPTTTCVKEREAAEATRIFDPGSAEL